MKSIKNYPSTLIQRPQSEGEEWVSVEGFGGKYSVSSHGRVWSAHSCRILSMFKMDNGYFRVNLTNNSVSRLHSIHRLVAQGFIDNPDDKPQVNHKDTDKANNNRDNLEWVTGKENIEHAHKSGVANIGVDRPDAKLNEQLVESILTDRYVHKLTQPELASKYRVSRTAIRNIIEGRTWKHVECEARELINSFSRISNKGKKHKKKR